MKDCLHEPATVRSDTRSVVINAPADHVFSFIADPTTLPQWAVGFCRSIHRRENGDWIVRTASGDMPIRFECNAETRTVDFYFAPAPGLEVAAFSRIVPNGLGSEYIFTQFQLEGMASEVFEAQVHALAEELQVLRGVMHARAACQSPVQQR